MSEPLFYPEDMTEDEVFDSFLLGQFPEDITLEEEIDLEMEELAAYQEYWLD